MNKERIADVFLIVPINTIIDAHIEVPRVDYKKLSGDRLGETSAAIRSRVQAARELQLGRFSNGESSGPSPNGNVVVCNADMRVGEVR